MPRKKMDLKVVLEPQERGWWMATIPQVPGCRTQGRSVATVRYRIREALSLYREDAAEVPLKEEFVVPSGGAALVAYQQHRHFEEQAHQKTQEWQQKAITDLRKLGLSTRDIGAIMGLSPSRVHQRKAG